MKLEIDVDQATDIVSAAILHSLSSDQRDKMVTEAIAYLLAPTTDSRGYGANGPSPIEQAFRNALAATATRIVHEVIEQDESLFARLRSEVTTFVAAALLDDGVVRGRVTEAVVRALGDGGKW